MVLPDLTDQTDQKTQYLDLKDPRLPTLQRDQKDPTLLILCFWVPKDPTRQRDRTHLRLQKDPTLLTDQTLRMDLWVLELNF
jgi:hypothetical protein